MQMTHRQNLFNELSKEYSILREYNKLMIKRAQFTGFKAEQIDKILYFKAKEITSDKVLYKKLLCQLPTLAISLTKFTGSRGIKPELGE